ncbi:hypothetical protein [Bradyrhizobium sp. th.b2]|uniref:hypothetical protein n=1 Tax=Bradyrhizobium sp. th-b2 TaxID=172088 RepID=UPI000A0457DB|nr:hypothetical protein [Bradyrhizobium sp. th.b2]
MDQLHRRRTKLEKSSSERLAEEAQYFREEALKLSPGAARELLLRRACQTETASHMDDWLKSPGLKSPE